MNAPEDMTRENPKTGVWRKIRRTWATLGIVAFIGFMGWCFVAYRATGGARRALQSDEKVKVVQGDGCWEFGSNTGAAAPRVGLVFFAGSLADPVAYAPPMRGIAQQGFRALLIELPLRGTFGGGGGGEVLVRARAAMQRTANVSDWIVAGHSLGGAVAARFVREDKTHVVGLVLVGTSHPRSFSLAEITLPAVKILGSRDGVAAVEKSEEFRRNLPVTTRWIVLEGANHSQFGYYGFQPGDHSARISREAQQELTLQAIVEALKGAVRERTSALPLKFNPTLLSHHKSANAREKSRAHTGIVAP